MHNTKGNILPELDHWGTHAVSLHAAAIEEVLGGGLVQHRHGRQNIRVGGSR